MLDTIVFGRRSGEAAAIYAQEASNKPLSETVVSQDEERIRELLAREDNGDTLAKIRYEMGASMNEHLAVFRTQEGMETARSKLQELRDRYRNVPVQDKGKVFNTNLVFALELGFMLDCTETIVAGALERKESRGAHYLLDNPNRDDENWLKHVVLYYTPEGPRVEYQPVSITKWQPQARTY